MECFLWFSHKEIAMTDLIHGILGIDISKAKFDVALMVAGKVKKTRVFENAPDGFKALSDWLLKQGISSVSACMEATGCYGDAWPPICMTRALR
jgi:Transposase